MFVWILESLIHIRYMAPIKTLKGCSSDDYKEGICGNYQGLLFTKNGTRSKVDINLLSYSKDCVLINISFKIKQNEINI